MAIGEFSDRSGLSAKRLRTYAAEGLLTPAAVDPGSGYRYYSPGQLADAEMIDALRQAGVPLAEIRAFMRAPSRAQLHAWARQLQATATHRSDALELACQLFGADISSDSPTACQPLKEQFMTHFKSAGRTDIGRLRANNEDVILSSDRLAVVADGMGGHPGGEIAAAVAAGVVPEVFTGRSLDELEAAVRAANWAIRERASAEAGLDGMGTTICAAGLLSNGDVALVNVGDSRAYLWRDGALVKLTDDHSVTASLVQCGELREEEAAEHPHFGILTRALGVGTEVEVDCRTLDVEIGDRLVLCTDGLSNELTDKDIAKAMAGQGSIDTVVDDLIEKAVTQGGRDNVSAVVVEVAG